MKLRWSTFRVAFSGIAFLLRTQVNARWHLLATVAVVTLGLVLKISRIEWLAILLATALVWVGEALNTALEQACDAITRERHPLIGRAKDVAAGAVLLAAIFAGVIGLIVFIPYLT